MCASHEGIRGRVYHQHWVNRGLTANFSAAYASSKWALRGLSGSAAFCLADWGIRCNIIEPGFIKTNMTKNMPIERVNDVVLLRRPGDADEIAEAALFLASDEPSYTTGAEILVDGGFYAPGPYLAAERGMGFPAKLQEAMEPADDAESEQGTGVIDKSV